jgi:hypothetical protein
LITDGHHLQALCNEFKSVGLQICSCLQHVSRSFALTIEPNLVELINQWIKLVIESSFDFACR